jgi:polysaccharide biosynthesis protein PslH
MRILFVSSRLPWPLDRGDRLICYHRLRTLSKNNKITLITFYQSPEEVMLLSKISPFCEKIYPIYLPKWKIVINIFKCLFNRRIPFQSACYLSSEFQLKINEILKAFEFDVVHYFLLRVAEYSVPAELPKVVELIDSMQLNLLSRLDLEKPLRKVLFREELRRLSVYEKQIMDKFDHSILVSEKDKEYFGSNHDQISIVPNGIDFNVFKPIDKNGLYSNVVNIIFSGNMSYIPNIQAIQWFVNNCWDAILQQCTDAQLIIAGVEPVKEIIKLEKNKRIKVTGKVESMAETIAQADISIVPMQSGSGMQNKILEAMACGIPIVASTFGLGTIKAINNESILIADTPSEFIDRVILLIEDQSKRERIGLNALKFVKNNHNWDLGGEKIQSIYDKLAAMKAR